MFNMCSRATSVWAASSTPMTKWMRSITAWFGILWDSIPHSHIHTTQSIRTMNFCFCTHSFIHSFILSIFLSFLLSFFHHFTVQHCSAFSCVVVFFPFYRCIHPTSWFCMVLECDTLVFLKFFQVSIAI